MINLTAKGSKVALRNEEIICEYQGVVDASVFGKEDQGVHTEATRNVEKQIITEVDC